MMTNFRSGWYGLVMTLSVTLALCSPGYGANSTDELGGEAGKYAAQVAAPDSLTSTKSGKTLKVTGGSATPDRPFDQGKVKLTSKSGATAVFSGRSTSWGCTFTVTGVYEGGGGGGQGGAKDATWTNTFEDESNPRIVLEINDAGTGDDVVLIGNNGGKLFIRVLDTTGTVQVTLSADPSGKLSNLPGSVNVAAGDTPHEVALNGQAAGQVTINASATVNQQQISSSIAAKVLGFRGKVIPTDNFTGRSLQKLGVGETGSLGVDLAPGTTLNDLKPLTWAKTAGTALTIANVNTDAGTATFTAGESYGEVTLTLTDKNNNAMTYSVTVVTPTDVVYEQTPGTGIKHIQGQSSVGFRANWYYRPKDVSFHFIKAGEGSCDATLNGWFALKFPSGLNHPVNGPWDIGTGDITKGCLATPPDQIYSGSSSPPAYAAGWFTWDIPQRWRLGSGTWHDIVTKQHRVDIDATGKKTIQKGGVGPFSKNLNDPTTDY